MARRWKYPSSSSSRLLMPFRPSFLPLFCCLALRWGQSALLCPVLPHVQHLRSLTGTGGCGHLRPSCSPPQLAHFRGPRFLLSPWAVAAFHDGQKLLQFGDLVAVLRWLRLGSITRWARTRLLQLVSLEEVGGQSLLVEQSSCRLRFNHVAESGIWSWVGGSPEEVGLKSFWQYFN